MDDDFRPDSSSFFSLPAPATPERLRGGNMDADFKPEFSTFFPFH